MSNSARIVLYAWAWRPSAGQIPAQQPVLRAPGRQRGAPGRTPISRRTGMVGWRTLGANNRELGRAASAASGIEGACESVRLLQGSLAQTTSRIVREAGVGWVWRIALDDEPVVVSSRSYQRQRECGYNLDQFCAVFPTAEVLAPPAQLLRALGRDVIQLPRVIKLPGSIELPTRITLPDVPPALVGLRPEVKT